jgi:protein-tyrosine phosphatase
MIDIHSHIVPGVDDGSPNLEVSLEILRAAAAGGTTAFVATPHVIEQIDLERLPLMAERFRELEEAATSEGIPLKLHLGGEIYPGPMIAPALDRGLPLTLAGRGRHMLVDLPMGPLPHDFGSILYEIQMRGVTPIIAHPERCAQFQAEPESLQVYLDKGMACQINAGSLFGKYGPRAAEVGEIYLRRRWANFVASDVHRPPKRAALALFVERMGPELGDEYIEILTLTSGLAVLEGKSLPPLPTPPPEKKQERGWFGRLFRRA